jgi:hypothetical protein
MANAMWPHGVEVLLPSCSLRIGLFERVEQSAIQQLVAETAVEKLDTAILSRTLRLAARRPGAGAGDSTLHGLGH